MAIEPEQSILDLAARTATAYSDLIHVNSGGSDYKQAKSDFVSDLAQEVTFNTSSSLTSQVNAYSSARGAGYYFGKIASYGAQSVTGVPENDNYYVEFIVWDANNCKLTVSSTSVDKVFDQWKGGGTWGGTWQQRPRRSEITALNSSLTNKQNDLGFSLSYSGQIAANGSYSLSASGAHLFLVLFGTWNFKGVYLVNPQNGGTLQTVTILNTVMCSFSVNGSWGFKVNNLSTSYAMPVKIYELM